MKNIWEFLIGFILIVFGIYLIQIKEKALYLVGVKKITDLSYKDNVMKYSNWIILYTIIFSMIISGLIFILMSFSIISIQ